MHVCLSVLSSPALVFICISSGGAKFKTATVSLSWRHRTSCEDQNMFCKCSDTVVSSSVAVWLQRGTWFVSCRHGSGFPGSDWGAVLWDGFTQTGGHGGIRHIFSHQQRCVCRQSPMPHASPMSHTGFDVCFSEGFTVCLPFQQWSALADEIIWINTQRRSFKVRFLCLSVFRSERAPTEQTWVHPGRSDRGGGSRH